MKRCAVILLSVLVVLLNGCINNVQQSREIDSLSEYSLGDLRYCFEAAASEQNQGDSSVLCYQQVSYYDAMQRFDSCVLRRTPGDFGNFAYTAYKVKEGGVYYVQWDLGETGSPNDCIDRIYLASLPKISELKKIRKGDSYSKLAEIDQSTRIVYRSAFNPVAYSLASNGKVYGFELDPSADDEGAWTVVKISDCTVTSVFLATLLKCDYPN